MNARMVARILGTVLFIFAALLLLPAAVALIYGENALYFIIPAALSALTGFVLTRFTPHSHAIFSREGFTSVGLAWISMGLFGALPFVLSGDIPNYIDAVFETVSGLTTTGASIMSNVEGMSRSGLFWRCFTHWIGGMGVLVFIMAVLPMGDEHSMHIMRAEVPGPTVGKLVPKARDTARILYIIYAALTAIETVFLMCGGMSFYEALLHAFATAGTGGFSTRNASVAAFNSVYIEMVIAVFLMLFGINFNLYYFVIIGRIKDALRSEELHAYLGLIAGCTLAIAIGIAKMYGGLAQGLRHAFFNTLSIVTTAGFGTVDFVQWPAYAHYILVLLMFIGGCAGSTGGGLKLSRVILLIKTALADLVGMLHPREVRRVQMDGKRVDEGTTKAVYGFAALYVLVILAAGLIVSLDGYDFTTNFTAALSCMSNVGPGLSLIGPSGNFTIFSPFSKVVLTVVMLLGRLEIYPLFMLASPLLWKKR